MPNKQETREQIGAILKAYYAEQASQREFVPGKTPIMTGEAIFGFPEVDGIVGTLLDGWLGLGKRGEEFESTFSSYLGNKHAVVVNSGSTANLLALNAVKIIYGVKSGEIITPAATFPTTFNPILQLGFTPAVVDVDSSLNLSLGGLEKAINSKSVGIMFAHTLGNPARIQEIKGLADKHGLFVIEDCCDALGSKQNGQLCGTFGQASTFSFYPAHGITMGEGGLISTNDPQMKKILRRLRDWGRDCWCNTDEKNVLGTCRNRFNFKVDYIPYDHKYVYSEVGYNVKPLELQAAMGLEQLKRLPGFIEIRRKNYAYYREKLREIEPFVEFPDVNPGADPVFFGLPMTLKNSKYDRKNLTLFLNEHKIATRLLFAGNILRQPAYKNAEVKVYQPLENSDKLMRDCFWVGLHAGVDEQRIDYVVDRLKNYFKQFK